MNIQFEKANFSHKTAIFKWLNEPHVQEFWDNSQEHKDDILNFIHGRIEPSPYSDGLYTYWVGLINGEPYSLLMIFHETSNQSRPQIKENHLSTIGTTYSIDYMIGNKSFFGKGLGAETLEAFTEFFHQKIDKCADTFFIDPDLTNPRAKHVYEKAGFEYVADFIMEGDGVFAGRKSHFLVKKLHPKPHIIPATLSDYPTIQNMSRFYVYDASRDCGFISQDWAIPSDGLYESFDFKCYFEAPHRKAFLVKFKDELAGFVLLRQEEETWHIGEFFILAKFQRKGFGTQVAHQIWEMYPGSWELWIIPENKRALSFWRTITSKFRVTESLRNIEYDKDQPQRVILSFDTKKIYNNFIINIRPAIKGDIQSMVALSKLKRQAYEKEQPKFWKSAQNSDEIQSQWFEELLTREDHVLLVAEIDTFEGFIIGNIINAPEVYDPGGSTLMIDDFCVKSSQWSSIGEKLLKEMRLLSQEKNVTQLLIVSGTHDEPKRQFLKNANLRCVSQWYVGEV